MSATPTSNKQVANLKRTLYANHQVDVWIDVLPDLTKKDIRFPQDKGLKQGTNARNCVVEHIDSNIIR